jgi:demethylmenaquinone methyltransferase/2-methoxy-6-polyprenyl-1,4-benzoquinol methylase
MAGTEKQKEEGSALAIREIFDRIAFRYDLLNDLFSARIHHHWIKVLVKNELQGSGLKVLDVCTGTGAVAIAAARHNPDARIIGVDISEPMLSLAREKIARLKLGPRIDLRQGDGSAMPLADQSVDTVFNSFGLRNQGDYKKALTEMARVLKPGGRLNILEFSRPANVLIRRIYMFYLMRIMPAVSRLFLRERASFDHLARTIKHFPAPEAVAQLLRDCGFTQVRVEPLTGGIVCVYRALRGSQGPQDKNCPPKDISR